MNQDEILKLFREHDASWVHDGDPKKPHAELTSGLCSNGYFDCSRVLCHPNVADILANRLIDLLAKNKVNFTNIDWVVGSAYAAITFSYDVARLIGAIHGFVEKDPMDPSGKRMIWRRMTIPKGARVLQIEELITTSSTFREVRRAVTEGNAEPVEFLPIVGSLVHRPPQLPADYDDINVVALVEKEVWAVKPEDCPLCKAGSKRFRPKSHWAELTGKK